MAIALDPQGFELARLIRPDDVVVCAQASSEPLTLTEALVAQADRIGPMTVFLGATFSDTFWPGRAPNLRFAGLGGLGNTHRVSRAAGFGVVREPYSRFSQMFASGELRCDVALISLAPGHNGEPYSTGPTCDHAIDAARHARLVIAEINEALPYAYGAFLPEDIRPHYTVRSTRTPPLYQPAEPSLEEHRIAAHVARQVPNGATIELGIGSIAEAIAQALSGHADLGLHTGMLSNGLLPLLERGVITNRGKGRHPGVSVAGMVVGGPAMYAYATRNPRLAVRHPRYTHAPDELASLRRFIAINAAIEVDLSGGVNAETVGAAYVGGLGGLPDFALGAKRSNGGSSIIALPSTARGGTVSRIVPKLSGAASIDASLVDLVITEWGVATLRGATPDERARRLVAVAHPEWRERLERSG